MIGGMGGGGSLSFGQYLLRYFHTYCQKKTNFLWFGVALLQPHLLTVLCTAVHPALIHIYIRILSTYEINFIEFKAGHLHLQFDKDRLASRCLLNIFVSKSSHVMTVRSLLYWNQSRAHLKALGTIFV